VTELVKYGKRSDRGAKSRAEAARDHADRGEAGAVQIEVARLPARRLKIKLRRVGSGRICAKRAQVAGNGLKSQEMGSSGRKWGGISPRLPQNKPWAENFSRLQGKAQVAPRKASCAAKITP
jgi:hypothetical protein